MIKLKVRIKDLGRQDVKLRELNSIIREGLTKAAEWWIEECLPKHFESGAVQRYSMVARKPAYLAVKRRMQKVRLWAPGYKKGAWVPAPKPSGPLCWTGELKRTLLSKSIYDFNIKAVSTSNKHKVTIPCPIPHPMAKENAAEITRLIQSEMQTMQDIAFEYIKAKLTETKESVELAVAA